MREYMTMSGDRWDLIAYRLYPDSGRERNMSRLIMANSDYVGVVIFPAGVKLNVPDEVVRSAKIIPPWRRGS
ncbi:MAG: tail protein X [Synergistaceae bacterium]|nr:tail protein X [Synergistaceae bacterium]